VEQAVVDMSAVLGERASCMNLQIPRGNFQRRKALRLTIALETPPVRIDSDVNTPLACGVEIRRRPDRQEMKRARRPSSRALNPEQRQAILDAVHQMRFIDRSVPYIYATLLDEGWYYGSISTIYRILHSVGEVGERRDQATRPASVKPELCATGPNQVYTWDITKLHGPHKWTYFYLYAVIDIYSRYVVGWMVADRESSELARILLKTTIEQQQADPTKLTIHADRGSSMKSKPVAFMLADLGVTKSHSRPHVSNDNPYIESFFKTAKYQPEFPSTFANIAEARSFCRTFIDWYNAEHRHSGIALLTPADVHYGRVQERTAARQGVLDAAYTAHPERFVHGRPRPLQLASASYINRPLPLIPEAPRVEEANLAA
jgi:putative transposase